MVEDKPKRIARILLGLGISEKSELLFPFVSIYTKRATGIVTRLENKGPFL